MTAKLLHNIYSDLNLWQIFLKEKTPGQALEGSPRGRERVQDHEGPGGKWCSCSQAEAALWGRKVSIYFSTSSKQNLLNCILIYLSWLTRQNCTEPLTVFPYFSVVGTPFYLMDYVSGKVHKIPSLPDLSPSDRTKAYKVLSPTKIRKYRFNVLLLAYFVN